MVLTEVIRFVTVDNQAELAELGGLELFFTLIEQPNDVEVVASACTALKDLVSNGGLDVGV